MPRLITFGCSFTYGHGLPDCYISKGNRSGPKPSKLAWPQLIADKLGRDCINLSQSGSGNKEILNAVLNCEFQPDDLVIIGWTFFVRYDVFRFTDNGGHRLSFNGFDYKNYLRSLKILTSEWEYDNSITNYIAIEFIQLYLASKNINYLSLFYTQDFQLFDIPKFVTQDNVFKISVKEYSIDRALDNHHFGIESHKLLAQKIYDKITA